MLLSGKSYAIELPLLFEVPTLQALADIAKDGSQRSSAQAPHDKPFVPLQTQPV